MCKTVKVTCFLGGRSLIFFLAFYLYLYVFTRLDIHLINSTLDKQIKWDLVCQSSWGLSQQTIHRELGLCSPLTQQSLACHCGLTARRLDVSANGQGFNYMMDLYTGPHYESPLSYVIIISLNVAWHFNLLHEQHPQFQKTCLLRLLSSKVPLKHVTHRKSCFFLVVRLHITLNCTACF